MQALGAYGFRGFYERKAHFLQSVPYALKNVRWLLHNVELPIALPTLMDAFTSMVASEKLQSLASQRSKAENLTVRIFSFSFHRGMPKDETGHGGGFVFDARSLPNPGREERFKALTGKDAPVIEYLNQQESVHQFLASVMSLVDASVSEYQRRGFTSLMVSFGCTGGQHRSVYLAEQLAKHLSGRNGVEVVVRHRRAGEHGANESDDSGRRPRHALAAAHRRSPQGAGGSRRAHACWRSRSSRLRSFGVRDVIINVHHFADMIVEYLKANDNFGMRIEVSREEVLLDTGGGLKKAAHFFLEDPSALEEPFILHNVDVISTIDLRRMVQFHTENQALATLAVQDRETSRYLLFDEQLQLCGRRSGRDRES